MAELQHFKPFLSAMNKEVFWSCLIILPHVVFRTSYLPLKGWVFLSNH